MKPGTPSGPAALWLGVRRKASCMMIGVVHPKIIGVDVANVGWMCPNQERGARGSVGRGDRATVSIYVILATTSSGSVMRRPVVSSRNREISVGRKGASVTPSLVRMKDLSATLSFFKKGGARPFRITCGEGYERGG
jgi:hypothetical protein